MHRITWVLGCLLAALAVEAQPFHFPTANEFLFEPGGEEKFFVGTPGRTWVSGAFGCVRSEGGQMHEGLDIRCLLRDKHDEPTDPILATASGQVAYVNRKAFLSNYGIYIVLRHQIEGMTVYSLYAHLSRVAPEVAPGNWVQAGEVIGVMGRTANTRSTISKERAHLHFEIALLLNEHFASWYAKEYPGQRNDHGDWNGQNMAGLDPRQILLTQRLHGERFSLVHVIRSQPELMRVMVRDTDFSWMRRYPQLVAPNPVADAEGIAGYEVVFNFNGVAFQLIPRAASEISSTAEVELLSVNEAEYELRGCRDFVVRRGSSWKLTRSGERLLELLLY